MSADSPIDPFMQFNRKPVQDRQIDTLIGLAKGITADGIVNQQEAEFLLDWLTQNRVIIQDNPIFQGLFERVSTMLEDGVLDADEQRDLLSSLQSFSGKPSLSGEFIRTTDLPVNQPEPRVIFQDKRFLFTGTSAFGTRKQCAVEVEKRGGIVESFVVRRLDYLVLGAYVTPSWKHETYGTKIHKAMEYRDQKGLPLKIVTEQNWANSGGIQTAPTDV